MIFLEKVTTLTQTITKVGRDGELILENLWEADVKGCDSHLIKDAEVQTGLSTQEVKIWVSNRQKKAKRASNKKCGIKPKRAKKNPISQKRGYLFMSDRMNQEDLNSLGPDEQGKKLKIAQAEWRDLPDSEKAKWIKKAANEPCNIEHDSMVKHKLSTLQANCKELWGCP